MTQVLCDQLQRDADELSSLVQTDWQIDCNHVGSMSENDCSESEFNCDCLEKDYLLKVTWSVAL